MSSCDVVYYVYVLNSTHQLPAWGHGRLMSHGADKFPSLIYQTSTHLQCATQVTMFFNVLMMHPVYSRHRGGNALKGHTITALHLSQHMAAPGQSSRPFGHREHPRQNKHELFNHMVSCKDAESCQEMGCMLICV